jgi:hypothetical protein
MKLKRMGITEILRRSRLFSANQRTHRQTQLIIATDN